MGHGCYPKTPFSDYICLLNFYNKQIMKKLYFSLLFIMVASLSFGQVIISETFTYADGSLVGNGGWATHSGTPGDMTVTSGQVLVQHGTPSEDANISFSAVSGTIYYAIDITVVDPGGAISGSDSEYFAHFNTSGFRARVDIVPPSGGGDYTVGIATNNSTAEATWASDLTFGQTYRITVEYDQDNDASRLWVDASASTDTSISGSSAGAAGSSITSFALRQSDSSNNEGILVDNLIVGNTFDDTIPNTSCGVTLGVPNFICTSNTPGIGNDGVTLEIPYTGVDAGITSVFSISGVVGGDDPATVTDGTIVVTGLMESEAWQVTLNGGDCDGVTASGFIEDQLCHPVPGTCFDLSTGGELSELVVV